MYVAWSLNCVPRSIPSVMLIHSGVHCPPCIPAYVLERILLFPSSYGREKRKHNQRKRKPVYCTRLTHSWLLNKALKPCSLRVGIFVLVETTTSKFDLRSPNCTNLHLPHSSHALPPLLETLVENTALTAVIFLKVSVWRSSNVF